jgi:hypothetical protein
LIDRQHYPQLKKASWVFQDKILQYKSTIINKIKSMAQTQPVIEHHHYEQDTSRDSSNVLLAIVVIALIVFAVWAFARSGRSILPSRSTPNPTQNSTQPSANDQAPNTQPDSNGASGSFQLQY